MDIITEILETDNLASQKLEEAQARKLEILKEAEDRENQLKEDAKKRIEDYRVSRHEEIMKKTNADVLKIRTAEQVKIHGFDTLFEENHEAWEKEIIEGILGE